METLYIQVKDKLSGSVFTVELCSEHPSYFSYCNAIVKPFHADGVIYDNLFAAMQNLSWELLNQEDELKIQEFYSKLF